MPSPRFACSYVVPRTLSLKMWPDCPSISAGETPRDLSVPTPWTRYFQPSLRLLALLLRTSTLLTLALFDLGELRVSATPHRTSRHVLFTSVSNHFCCARLSQLHRQPSLLPDSPHCYLTASLLPSLSDTLAAPPLYFPVNKQRATQSPQTMCESDRQLRLVIFSCSCAAEH